MRNMISAGSKEKPLARVFQQYPPTGDIAKYQSRRCFGPIAGSGEADAFVRIKCPLTFSLDTRIGVKSAAFPDHVIRRAITRRTVSSQGK
ncbi:hypothetical protein DSM25558_2267 [Agrobacterium sp. DSM 25558]|uniref:hypothetical protein n=1 Tax=Agrobacterium sp. DSM 25558 TaxID=1907665 RepID=UPI00097244DF|nr:hypothetical protein [Agrobacterium sp. DSM 25558]SCX17188.1 hypothetical protein DSM25558_2267 [Agrobacterium sp. DSM 25558]